MPFPALIPLLVAFLTVLFDTPSASASDPLYDLAEEEYHTELIGAVGDVLDPVLDHRVNWRSARPKTFNGHVYFTYIDPIYRPRIAKLSLNNGTVETDWVVDPTYTLTKQNDGHYYFTLGIDPDGYIHVVGNMHNGDSVDINHWRSNNPEDISAFTLKQGSEGPQGDYFTYPHMRNDLNGNLYHWARIYREAPWPVKFGLGLSAHDVASQQWSMIGAPVPGGDQTRTVTVFEDNHEGNGNYQQPRMMIHFDRNNRMHIAALVLNYTPSSYAGNPHFGTDVLYAYSDDGGQTIHKSDGSQIQWPMRVESGANQGEIVFSDYSDYLDLPVFLATDRDNNPIILAGTLAASDPWHLFRRESGTWVDYGNLGNDSRFGGLFRDPWGVMTVQLDDNKIIRFWDPDSPVEIDLPHKPIYVNPTQSSSIDASWMRDTGEMIYTVQDSANDQIKLYRTLISRPDGNAPDGNAPYCGQAYVAGVSYLDISETWGDTGPLPPEGGSREASLLDFGAPGLPTGVTGHAATVGQAGCARSEASASSFSLDAGGVAIEASFVMARASACYQPSGGTRVSGSTEFQGLTVAGIPVVLTGEPNQIVPLPGGFIVVDEQIETPTSIRVTALRIEVDGAEFAVASAVACYESASEPPAEGDDRLTGGGHIGLPGGGKGTFGVTGGYKNGSLSGHLTYHDHDTGMKVKGTGVTSYQIGSASNSRRIEGTAEVDGVDGYTYVVEAADNGEPGGGDTFSINVSNGYHASGPLTGGNIQLHEPGN